jgi:predicted HTH transcriptional regulator
MISMESVIYENRQEYYRAIESSRKENDAGAFIEFTLASLYASIAGQINRQSGFPDDGEGSGGENGGENGGEGLRLNATQAAVLAAIKKDSHITIKQLIAVTGRSESTIERAIKALKERGLVKRTGPDKGGSWRVGD